MAFANLLPEITPSHCCFCNNSLSDGCRPSSSSLLGATFLSLLETSRRSPVCSAIPIRCRDISFVRRWRLNASTLRLVDNNVNDQLPTTATVEIPVTCYQIVGVADQAEKDQIVKSVMDLRNAEIEEGYTMEAVVSRGDLLMDVRDKLLFEPEYAGNVREKIPPKSSLCIPWAWLPGALCLLQEVGEEKLVLEIGRAALQCPGAKQYAHDLLLSMALAECAIAKTIFEKNHVSEGFEALARAQCLLMSEISLKKIKLLSQIEKSLEELAPACTVELLALPHTADNAERRCGAIAALRELLRQGLNVETACQVHDWPCFLSQALSKLMASEIVDLLSWDSLATTRKNKKSLESQNQRVVIDFDGFYTALIAHIALGFSSRQIDLITKAKTICECLVASEGIDLKFEGVFCLFLLGECDETDAVEMLQKLELNTSHMAQNSILAMDSKDAPLPNSSLEMWLKDAVLSLFSDTRDCSPSLANFFAREKKAVGNKQNNGVAQTVPFVSYRALSHAPSDRKVSSEHRLSQHLGPAVKQLAPADSQSPLLEAKPSNRINMNMPSAQLKRNLGSHHKAIENWLIPRLFVEKAAFVTVLACIVFATCKLLGGQSGRISASKWVSSKAKWTKNSALSHCSGNNSSNYDTADGIKKLLSLFMTRIRNLTENRQNSCLTASLSSPLFAVHNRPMPVEEAEVLVMQWQTIKAEALGPDHQVHLLFDVLEDPMLHQWQDLADAAKVQLCFWRFVLLQLSVLRAEILSDNIGPELAEIEVLLEEAAELVDESQDKNPNYYSTYKISYILKRQDDGSWKFIKAEIQTPS
ncbi:hypothetical protein Nepgr_033397 [Nepenthes gracilis]|uniref:ARC6 IMS domain-containing protein n=1 Tax=Nepenthes gracilis TaxID=150966 RepID=A0AAD3TMB0_NEPGR|nr:hypothetical protein Nepgr_033397 [Nepenthes gracilis]